MTTPSDITINSIRSKLYDIRGYKVMLDSDLAEYYGIETKRLNEAVKRNLERFPLDFMFQLTEEEAESLRSQIRALDNGRGKHRKYLPHVFTEKGAWTLSFLLKSEQAAQKGIQLIRVLEQLRDVAVMNPQLLGQSMKSQLASQSSIINHYHGPVTINQQGNNNQMVMNQADLVMELVRMRSETENKNIQDRLDLLAAVVAKGDKSEAKKTIDMITASAKVGSEVYKFGVVVAKLIGPWLL